MEDNERQEGGERRKGAVQLRGLGSQLTHKEGGDSLFLDRQEIKAPAPRVRHALSLRRVARPGSGRAEPVLVAVDSHGFAPPVRADWKVIAWDRRPEPVAPRALSSRGSINRFFP